MAFLSSSLYYLAACISVTLCQQNIYEILIKPAEVYDLPALPYPYDGLEPFLDEMTLRVHHLGHHKSYANKMNAALKDWRLQEPSSQLAQSSIVEILQKISDVPSTWRTSLKNNGGGYVNHILYWSTMCYNTQTEQLPKPQGELLSDLVTDFGSFSLFQDQFSEAATKLFGSGYVWLVESAEGKLRIVSTQNQDSPISEGLQPLLVLDVWEHAYYLKHQNKRGDYIADWWNVVCWPEVATLRLFWNSSIVSDKHTEL